MPDPSADAPVVPVDDVRLLLDGITASELDAAVMLEVVTWADVVRFAVDRLVDGWDTPALRELAAEPTDERRVVGARVAPRWRRLLEELGVASATIPATAVMRHGAHLLRLWHEQRLDLLGALAVLSRLRPPLVAASPVTPEVRTLDLLMDCLTYAMERPEDEDVAGHRRAAVAGLHALEAAIRARVSLPPAPHVFTPSSWCGGMVDLDVELPAEVGDADLRAAVEALREEAGIVGASPDRDTAPGDHLAWNDPEWAGEFGAHAYGTAAHPGGFRVVCGHGTARSPDDRDGTVRLELWVPAGALTPVHPLAGTFADGSAEWLAPMHAWFTDVATRLHRRVDYRLARIAFELDARPSLADLDAHGVPAGHRETFVIPRDGRLEIHPPSS